MTDTLTATALAYYARHGAALFPCAAGTKRPILKWKDGSTTDPAAWAAWTAEGHNLAIDCAKSGLIMVDVDASKVSREQAWQAYHDLCVSWGLPAALAPSTQSARGGWHIPFRRPVDLSPADLRGGGTLVKISDIRPLATGEQDGEVVGFKNRGYCVAPGSTLDTPAGPLPYLLLPGAPTPHDTPAGLIEAIRLPVVEVQANGATGLSEPTDVANLVAQLDALGEFSVEPDWFKYLGAIKLALGDTEQGLEVARQMTRDDATEEALLSRWSRLASIDDGTRKCRIGTMIHRYKELTGKAFRVHSRQRTTQEMFGSITPVNTSMVVASIAANAGATLASGVTPGAPVKTMPMDGGQAELTRLATPILVEFLAATIDAPSRPTNSDHPTLPASMGEHGLFTLLNESITRVMAMVEMPKFKGSRCTSAMAVLLVAHKDVFESVNRRIEDAGRTLPLSKIKLAAKSLEDQVQRAFVKQDDWVYDQKGLPESDNPDNVVAFLGIIGAEIRWNAWLNRAEIQGFEWPKWCSVDDVVVAKLKMRALRTGTRFRVGNEFLRETLLALAHMNQHDPVVERINSLVWDRVPRLAIWLTATCGVPCDAYHQAVGKNVIGGMVKRARKPGAKHDEVMILIGKQGTMKSALCRVLAMNDEWFTDSVAFDGSPQNIVPQLFGKLVVELAELDGMAKKEVQHIKAFITRQSDNVTLKYKAFASDHARRAIFIGTSNEDSPLVDITGNRRFLPVRVASDVNIQWLKANVEQLVAEAAHLENGGAEFSIPPDVWAIAAEHQEAARSVSDVEARLCEWFAETPHTASAFVTTMDLAELSDIAGWKNIHAMRNSILKRLGFREITPYINGNKTRGWLRGPEMLPRHVERVTRYVVGRTADNRPRVAIRSMEGPPAV